jgi:hypothetical protein
MQYTVCCSLLLLLTSCIGNPLLSDVKAEPAILRPTGHGEALDITYRVGQESAITIFLEDEADQRYTLRENEPRSAAVEQYTLRFDGTVPVDDAVVQRRLLPQGNYTVVVQAHTRNGSSTEQRQRITIAGNDAPLPAIENLVVYPQTISPNADAVDDIAEITYRLPITATVDIDITTPQGEMLPFVTGEEQDPAEWRHIWNGKRPDGSLLPNGVYTYTISAEDDFGNLVQRQGEIMLEEVGQPEATIIHARIAPKQLMLGETLIIQMRVKNTGDVPIRTYGPPDSYTYDTNQVYSSIEEGQYTAQAGGFWRIGVDWDANSGGGARRYPFRWALSEKPPAEWDVPYEEDWLQPGEVVDLTGYVTILQRETKMAFYVGLIQDGVGFFQDRTARTIVEVGF